MLRKIIACFLSCLFLTGAALLPLGDFSLMNDLPKMYQAYEKLATPDETGIIDFIGDYVFAGKALLGNNKNDKPENSGSAVQFQHSPTSFNFLCGKVELPVLPGNDVRTIHLQLITPGETAVFYSELFRPPLA